MCETHWKTKFDTDPQKSRFGKTVLSNFYVGTPETSNDIIKNIPYHNNTNATTPLKANM